MIQLLFHLCSSTLFIHSHIIEGNEIVHSHFFAGPVSEHSHTASNADSIARATFGETILPTTIVVEAPTFYVTTIYTSYSEHEEVTYIVHHSLRAPPVVA